MKSLLAVVVAALALTIPLQAETEKETTSQKADKTWSKTKEVAKEAGQAVADTTKKAAGAVVEVLTPDKDAHQVQVNLTGARIEMPRRISAGKNAFVVRNTSKEKQNFEIQGESVERGFLFAVDPNQTKTLQATLKRGKYKAYAIKKDGKNERYDIGLTVE